MEEAYIHVMEDDQIRAGLAIHMVGAALGAHPRRFTGGRLGDVRMRRTRWLAMYLSHVAFGWPLDRVGHAFGVNRQTAANACRWIEDARDRISLDALLDRLEGCLLQVFNAPAPDLGALSQ